MSEQIRNIKGTKDLLPDQSRLWLETESIIHNFMSLHGYSLIRTPIFEKTELFNRSIGQATDIVNKEMYTWIDVDGTSLTLRPELTAPVIRSYIQNQLGNKSPLQRVYYIDSSFRRERPQKGRQRQFTQYGIEAIGSNNPEQDVEIILIASRIYQMLGIDDIEIHINSIGSQESRLKYSESLVSFLDPYKKDLSEISQQRLETNPLRILDSKSEKDIKILEEAPIISNYLSKYDSQNFEEILKLLNNLNIRVTINSKLVRGLDYYNGMTFEILSNNIGSQSALCGGGRYDKLVESLGGKPTPAVGFAAGLERLILILTDKEKSIVSNDIDIYIISLDEESITYSFSIADKLRNTLGIKVVCETLRRSMKSQLREANKNNAKFAILIGENEINNEKVIIKNMEDGTQTEASIDEIENYFGVDYKYK
jgi:histidyl-tRNA synthetase